MSMSMNMNTEPMGFIPFTQYILPNGRTRKVTISRSTEICDKALIIRKRGLRFECEILSTGQVNFTITGQNIDVLIKICPNNEKVLEIVDQLVIEGYDRLEELIKMDEEAT